MEPEFLSGKNNLSAFSILSTEIPNTIITQRQYLFPFHIYNSPFGIIRNNPNRMNPGKSVIETTDPTIFPEWNDNIAIVVSYTILVVVILNDIDISVITDLYH